MFVSFSGMNVGRMRVRTVREIEEAVVGEGEEVEGETTDLDPDPGRPTMAVSTNDSFTRLSLHI